MARRDSVIDYVFFALLILMSVFSTVLMPVKIGIVAVLVIYIAVRTFTYRPIWKEDWGIAVWIAVYTGSNLFSIITSLIYKNPHALAGLSVSIIEPILLFIIIEYLMEDDFNFIFGKLRIIFLLICVYDTAYFLAINGYLPFINPDLFIGMYANYGGLSIGFTKIHSNNIPWLMFLFPMTVSELLLTSKRVAIIDYASIGFSILIAVMTLRSSYILTIVLTPILVLFYARISCIDYNHRRMRAILITCALLFLLLMTLSSRVRGLVANTANKVLLSMSTTVNSTDNGGYMRMEQIKDLLQTWIDKPVFGWGASANAKNIVRSDVAGSYEMQYFAMLMQRGIVGFTVFCAQVVWIIVMCLKDVRNNQRFNTITLGIVVAFTSMLIANATNPYFGSFDRLILFFMPLMAHRANLLHRAASDV